jgi:cytochrome P450
MLSRIFFVKRVCLLFDVLQRDGENWRRMRSILDRRMMRPAHVATYTDNFNDVVTDFVDRLRTIRDKKGGGTESSKYGFRTFPLVAGE